LIPSTESQDQHLYVRNEKRNENDTKRKDEIIRQKVEIVLKEGEEKKKRRNRLRIRTRTRTRIRIRIN
jgi:hypothetical protein